MRLIFEKSEEFSASTKNGTFLREKSVIHTTEKEVGALLQFPLPAHNNYIMKAQAQEPGARQAGIDLCHLESSAQTSLTIEHQIAHTISLHSSWRALIQTLMICQMDLIINNKNLSTIAILAERRPASSGCHISSEKCGQCS